MEKRLKNISWPLTAKVRMMALLVITCFQTGSTMISPFPDAAMPKGKVASANQ